LLGKRDRLFDGGRRRFDTAQCLFDLRYLLGGEVLDLLPRPRRRGLLRPQRRRRRRGRPLRLDRAAAPSARQHRGADDHDQSENSDDDDEGHEAGEPTRPLSPFWPADCTPCCAICWPERGVQESAVTFSLMILLLAPGCMVT